MTKKSDIHINYSNKIKFNFLNVDQPYLFFSELKPHQTHLYFSYMKKVLLIPEYGY